MILTGMLAVFAFIPGLPMFPFLVLAIISGFIARELKKRLPLTKATGATATKDGKSVAGRGR
jgi:flagellar biosynthesis component FlhA